MATGTSKNFILTGGSWTHSSTNFTPIVDDTPSNASSGIIVNGKRQWEWDMYSNTTHSREVTGSGDKLKFEYGTTTSNGIWTITGSGSGSASPVNGIVTIGTYATFTQSDAFVGNVPTHTDGHGSTSGNTAPQGGVGWDGSFYSVTPTHFSWKVWHTSAFTSPQTYELHSTTLTPTFISSLVVGAPAMSINSTTHNWTVPDVIEIRDAYGTVAAELTLSHSTNNKCSCNFW